MEKRGVLLQLVLFLFIMVISAMMVYSESSVPQGPDEISIIESGRHQNASNPITIQAKAGNVTALVINHTRVTEAWQGYYGNISGTITLDDSDNFTMYRWVLPNPQGEIYASNGSFVDWSNVYCMNLSSERNASMGLTTESGSVVYNTNSSQIELDFGINNTDWDGLNETFYDTYTDTTGFRVGTITIDNADGCSMAHPFTDEVPNTAWQELLLSDNNSIIFTSLIRENGDSYQPGAHTADFQMMVLENGHPDQEEAVTDYYFYVELS